MSPLRWTCKSATQLAAELTHQGHPLSAWTVGRKQKAESRKQKADGYSLQSYRKTKKGHAHSDRNAQFEHISVQVQRFQQHGEPVISADTKKKELIGPFKNVGREWRRKGKPDEVRVHDFMDKCGSNGSRCCLWKVALQELAVRLGMPIHVTHFPPGTSKWNKIEDRCFATSPRTGAVDPWSVTRSSSTANNHKKNSQLRSCRLQELLQRSCAAPPPCNSMHFVSTTSPGFGGRKHASSRDL